METLQLDIIEAKMKKQDQMRTVMNLTKKIQDLKVRFIHQSDEMDALRQQIEGLQEQINYVNNKNLESSALKVSFLISIKLQKRKLLQYTNVFSLQILSSTWMLL